VFPVLWAQLVLARAPYVFRDIHYFAGLYLSKFIEIATGLDTGGVGHTLESCTSEIKIVKLSVPELTDGDVIFVDTPGFDDTHKSDADILKMVADWLKTTYVC
jgi:hypothetical protein